MPINLTWIIPGRVIWTEYIGVVEVEQTLDVIHFVEDGLDIKQPHDFFHMIIDIRQNHIDPKKIPETLKTMTSEEYAKFRKHPNLGWTILISDNKMAQFITSLLTQTSKNRFRMMPNLKSSLELLKEQDQNLDWDTVKWDEIVS